MNLESQILDILHEESKKTLGNIVQYGKNRLEQELGTIIPDDEFELAITELQKNKLINVFPPLGKQLFTIYKISHKGFIDMDKFKANNEAWHKYQNALNKLADEGHGFFDKSLIDKTEKAKNNWQIACNDFSNWLIFQKDLSSTK